MMYLYQLYFVDWKHKDTITIQKIEMERENGLTWPSLCVPSFFNATPLFFYSCYMQASATYY